MSENEGQPDNSLVAKKFKIPGDIVNRATAELPDDQRSLIRWLHAHASEHDLSLDELAKLTRYDNSTLWRVFNGKYEGSLENVCKEIGDLKRLTEERNRGCRLAFIETKLSKKIWRVCEASLEYQRIAFILGETQIGKTMALIRYMLDHNHGSTVYVRMPVNPGFLMFLEAMAVSLRISPQQRERDLRRRIISAFDDRMLLIIDEAHQCLYSHNEASASRPIEFVREIYDAAQCGVVICGTPVFGEEMETGRFASILKQCKRRRLVKLVLPPAPSNDDLNTFAAAYGLDPAIGDSLKLQTDVIREEALGMWLTLLRMGAKIAAKAAQETTWEHIRKAYLGLKRLETLGEKA